MSVKRMIKGFIQEIINCFLRVGLKMDRDFPYKFLGIVANSFSDKTNRDVSFLIRPKSTDELTDIILGENTFPRSAVLLQGPLVLNDSYTLETIKLYKRIMPNVDIILSTWDDSDRKMIDIVKSLGCEVVISSPPLNSGIGNINYQVKSTMAGIEKAESMGEEYILKTRTDQRFLKKHLIPYLFSLLQQFPIGKGFEYLMQKERIIVGQSTYGGNMLMPYYISDFYFFGRLCDVKKYYDIPFQTINMSRIERENNKNADKIKMSMQDYQRKYAPEVILAENYVSCGGNRKLEYSVGEYWDFVKNYLICVTHEELQLCWPKYEKLKMENWINYIYIPGDSNGSSLTYTWTFANWLSLYCGNIQYKEELEEYRGMQAKTLDVG